MRAMLLPILLALAAGCMPGLYTSRPEVRGVVLDAATSRPIEGAKVAIGESTVRGSELSTTSDAAGAFTLPRARRFMVYHLLQGQNRWSYRVTAAAPGFAGAETQVSEVGQMPPKRIDGLRFELTGSRPLTSD